MINFLSFTNINKFGIKQRLQYGLHIGLSQKQNYRALSQAYSLASQRSFNLHSFRPFYSFSAQKQQTLKDSQQQKQTKTEQIKTNQTASVAQTTIIKEEDSKNKELELIFAKIKKKQEQIFDPNKHLQEFEKKVKTTNINVIKRELFNDSMQLPIKYLAYTLAGHASVGTFLAELCRSSIDAVNHLMLYFANYIDDLKQFQYSNLRNKQNKKERSNQVEVWQINQILQLNKKGTENIKYLVVLVPSLLFLFFGGYTIYSSFIEFLAATPIPSSEESDNLYSILLYLASFGIEISVIAYNIRDSIKMQNITNKEPNPSSLSIFQTLKQLIGKKDPLLQAVLYENFITLLSMSVPLAVGSYRLGKETIQALLGQSVDEDIMVDIHEEILKNPYVKSISNEKGIMSGSVRFKYTAVVEYDFESLNEDVMEDYRQMSDYIIYSQDYKDRQEELEELMESFPLRLLKEIKRQEELILMSIQTKYPQCDYFDLNMDTEKLYAFLDEEEKIKNSFHQELDSDDELKEETEEDKKIKEWILSESTKILQKRFTKNKMIKVKSQDQLLYDILHFKINPKHYSNSIHPILLQEKQLFCENQRATIISDDLNFDDNYRNEEDPLQ